MLHDGLDRRVGGNELLADERQPLLRYFVGDGLGGLCFVQTAEIIDGQAQVIGQHGGRQIRVGEMTLDELVHLSDQGDILGLAAGGRNVFERLGNQSLHPGHDVIHGFLPNDLFLDGRQSPRAGQRLGEMLLDEPADVHEQGDQRHFTFKIRQFPQLHYR